MSSAQATSITLLANVVDAAQKGQVPNADVLRDILSLTVRQGCTMQARILLSSYAGMLRYLELLPEVSWFDECWPGQGWPEIPPARHDPDGTPFFSVVTPSYNQAVFLKDTITSVLRQNFSSYEHIIMDGGSTDGTTSLLQQYPHLQWRSEKDRGQTHALNKALRQARGEVVAWINSDDFYLPGTFEAVYNFFMTHPHESVVTGDCLWGWEGTGRLRYVNGQERDFESLIRQWTGHVPGPQPSIFFRRKILETIGFGDENLHYGMDYDLWLRMATAGHVRRYINTPVAFYRFHHLSKSGAQHDWTPFYADWHECFSRHREHSKLLPKERMLTVVYPLSKDASARERASLCAALRLCSTWKFRDIDLVLITDRADMHAEVLEAGRCSTDLQRALPGLPVLTLPLKIVPISQLTPKSFAKAASRSSTSFAMCVPPISSSIPFEQWYDLPLHMLVDNPNRPSIPLLLRSEKVAAHPYLPPDGPLGCLLMHRKKSFASAIGE